MSTPRRARYVGRMQRRRRGRKFTLIRASVLCASGLWSSAPALAAAAATSPPEGTAAPRSAAATAKADLQAVLEATPDTRHGAILFQICTECHGPRGDGDASGWPPEIAGQHPRVIAKELTDFRAGVRWYDPMQRIARRHVLHTTQDIADAAAYVSSLAPSAATAMGEGKGLEPAGRLYAQRCEWCHGARGEGNDERFVPKVAAQQFEYLLRQLQDALEGRRPNMRVQHLRLLESSGTKELTALADYMSRLGRNDDQRLDDQPLPNGVDLTRERGGR